MHASISEFVISLFVGHQVVQPRTCKELQFLAMVPYYSAMMVWYKALARTMSSCFVQ